MEIIRNPMPIEIPEPKCKEDHVENYLRENHPTRVNKVTMRPEYLDDDGSYKSVTDYWVHGIMRELRGQFYTHEKTRRGKTEQVTESLAVSKNKIMEIIDSPFNRAVDVFHEYFQSLDIENRGLTTPNIDKLASTVKIIDPHVRSDFKASEFWPIALRKWLIAAVANFHNDYECENQTMLILVGKQNDGKTTWLNNLVPSEFNPKYRFCSGLPDPRGKDAMVLLVSMFLVNIDDQLGSITRKDADGIKNLITMPRVTVRLPYDKYINDHPHRASLCGSLNYTGFLNDPTGNRRYLPFEIDGINWNYLDPESQDYIDIDEVWAEAYHLWQIGEAYKFRGEELEKLNEHNKHFQTPTTEEDLINSWLEIPTAETDERDLWYMTTTEVECYLRAMAMSGNLRQMNLEKIKRHLVHAGFESKQKRINGKRSYVWLVVKVPVDADPNSVDTVYGKRILGA